MCEGMKDEIWSAVMGFKPQLELDMQGKPQFYDNSGCDPLR
jgi:hypothetical protein